MNLAVISYVFILALKKLNCERKKLLTGAIGEVSEKGGLQQLCLLIENAAFPKAAFDVFSKEDSAFFRLQNPKKEKFYRIQNN